MAKKELKEDTEESIGESLVTPVKTSPKKKGLSKKDEAILIQVLGVDTANRVMAESLVSVTKLDKTNRFEVTVDRQERPSTLFYFDDEDIIMEGPIEKTSKLSKILPNSVSATGKYSLSDMAKGVNRYLDRFRSVDTGRERRKTQVRLAHEVRNLTKNLSDVFGFDDPRQLETFMAAWLMKDSTCRLSGIPGTGKTTAIESSAILMANSYGYDTQPRYVRRPNGDIDLYEHGQNFEVYLNNLPDLRRAWDDWRFTPWSEGSDISGAYAFDFGFLQKNGPNGAKKAMRPSDFKRALFNADIFERRNTEGKLEGIEAKPLLVDATTKTKATLKGTVGPLYSVDYSKIISGSEEFETDAGSNQGYDLRKYLMENFYDSRLDSKSGRKAIQSEMLEEVGVAKIDYDKRADEVLYGMEIQQITTDLPTGDKMAAYAFEPIPRKVVTQPIKFFNEANRSQSGVEDAILGLIAERTVEYRGKTFDSPHFIAWMDTNPHQKGNDLAFIDRIDTELFFTTITLGERYNQLSGRHKGGSGLNPQQRLVRRITYDKNNDLHLKPYRFNELEVVWDFVHGSDDITPLPFSPPGAEGVYDGLRDIAMLSVMFTQRYFVRPATTHVLANTDIEHTLYSARDIHTSPLMDISKASNPMLLQDPQEDFALRYGNKDSDDPFQAPALFRRVLGFRFTNSLVKLSRAFAFLRSKDFVTREEILDALPYVVGHRLGPARAGEDSEGRTNGLVSQKAFGTLLNEQEMIREFIVHGYLLADTPSFLKGEIPRATGTDQTMMGAWDAFYSRCQEALRRSENFVDFEENVLYPVKREVLGQADSIILGYTPVHWHLATMVVENERNCPPDYIPLKNYSNSRCGPAKDYPDMYNKYLILMDAPAKADMSTSAALVADYALHDYYVLRGLIAREPHLFTDDRSRLLDLVESRINTIAKGPYSGITNPPPLASRFAIATLGIHFPIAGTGVNFRIEPSPTEFSLRTYGDALGAYGYMISRGTAMIEPASLNMNQARYTLNVQNWADQSMVLVGDYLYNGTDASLNPTQSDLQKSRLFQQMTSLEEVFGGNAGAGLIFYGDDENAYRSSGDLGLFLAECKQHLVNAMSGNPASLSMIEQGSLMACYELKHAPNSRGGAELERLGVKDMNNDTLRLWLRFRPLGTFDPAGGQVSFLLTIGITSNFTIGNEYEEVGGVIKITEGRLMGISDRSGVNIRNFSPSASASRKYGWDTLGMADAGNMTLEDMAYYQLLYHQVISGE